MLLRVPFTCLLHRHWGKNHLSGNSYPKAIKTLIFKHTWVSFFTLNASSRKIIWKAEIFLLDQTVLKHQTTNILLNCVTNKASNCFPSEPRARYSPAGWLSWEPSSRKTSCRTSQTGPLNWAPGVPAPWHCIYHKGQSSKLEVYHLEEKTRF